MADVDPLLAQARAAHARGDWVAARSAYHGARKRVTLTADDLQALSDSAWWMGAMNEMTTAAEESFHSHMAGGRARRAGLAALEIGITWMMRGERAVGSGWIARAQRMLEPEDDCAEKGYLHLLAMEAALSAGDAEGALTAARHAHECGRAFGDDTLATMGLFGEGRVRLATGDVKAGLAAMDEAMLSVVSGTLPPVFAGNLYCTMISSCVEIGEHRRAREWTAATEKWCATFPAAVMFLGVCRMHRAQLDVAAGRLDDAKREAERVCVELARMNVEAVAEAHYQLGEVRRIRGDDTSAEDSYTQAQSLGRDPQPGLSLLRAAQGRLPAARSAITAALQAAVHQPARAALLPAHVQIMIACGQHDAAAASADEMRALADAYGSPGFQAAALHAAGAVALARGQVGRAMSLLQDARRLRHAMEARYDTAQTALLLAGAYRAAGDAEAAQRERDAADALMAAMGARRAAPELPDDLSDREAAVVRLVAAGRTNKAIAEELFISPKTVARHLSNIFAKVGVGTRTALAAYAYQHGLAQPRVDG